MLPLRLATTVFEKLGGLGFMARGLLMARTDIYVSGKSRFRGRGFCPRFEET